MVALTTDASLHNQTVGKIAAEISGAISVFRKHNINFCCRGDAVLGATAQQLGIDVNALTNELQVLEKSNPALPKPLETVEMIDHILSRYHETHRRELLDLVELAKKVEHVHSEHSQTPRGLADLLRQIQGELEIHMKKEELILFPAMRRRARSGGALDTPIMQMRHEHVEHGEHLQKLERLTHKFALPGGACHSWQKLYVGLEKFADDLMHHVHLENNILFPRFQSDPNNL